MIKQLFGRGRLYFALRRMAMDMRRWRYGLRGVHPTAYICAGSCRDIRNDVAIGEFAFVNQGAIIGGRVRIGRYCMLAPRVSIKGADHIFDIAGTPTIFSGRPEVPETNIETDVWIGLGAVIMQGVRIGRGSIIGANSVVTTDVPPYEIWAGIPA